jgi:hypothetical protein
MKTVLKTESYVVMATALESLGRMDDARCAGNRINQVAIDTETAHNQRLHRIADKSGSR